MTDLGLRLHRTLENASLLYEWSGPIDGVWSPADQRHLMACRVDERNTHCLIAVAENLGELRIQSSGKKGWERAGVQPNRTAMLVVGGHSRLSVRDTLHEALAVLICEEIERSPQTGESK